MPIEFSTDDISIIENMMLTKTHKQVADMIGRAVRETGELIETICQREELMSYQAKQVSKKEKLKLVSDLLGARMSKQSVKSFQAGEVTKTPRIKATKTETEEKRLARERKEEKAAAEKQRVDLMNNNRNQRELSRRPLFKTQLVDYTKLRYIKVDKKTGFYIKPGENEVEARKKFLKNYARYVTPTDPVSAKPKKFKKCARCKIDKEHSEFRPDQTKRNGLQPDCIDCEAELDGIKQSSRSFE